MSGSVKLPDLPTSQNVKTRYPLIVGGATAAALTSVAVVYFAIGVPPPAPRTPAASAMTMVVIPWAQLEFTRTSEPSGKPRCDAPCAVSLPPGEYNVLAKNAFFDGLEFLVTVGAGKPDTVFRALPRFSPEAETNKVLASMGRQTPRSPERVQRVTIPAVTAMPKTASSQGPLNGDPMPPPPSPAALAEFGRIVSRGDDALAAKNYSEAITAFTQARAMLQDEYEHRHVDAKANEAARGMMAPGAEASRRAEFSAAANTGAAGTGDTVLHDGLLALMTGDSAKASVWLEHALVDASTSSGIVKSTIAVYLGVAEANLAHLLSDRAKDAKALSLFRKAMQGDPDLSARIRPQLERIASPQVLKMFDDASR